MSSLSDPIQANYEPIVITDTSGTTIYRGQSTNGNAPNANVWRIKKEWVSGNTTQMGFPSGDQSFIYSWSGRTGYQYT